MKLAEKETSERKRRKKKWKRLTFTYQNFLFKKFLWIKKTRNFDSLCSKGIVQTNADKEPADKWHTFIMSCLISKQVSKRFQYFCYTRMWCKKNEVNRKKTLQMILCKLFDVFRHTMVLHILSVLVTKPNQTNIISHFLLLK